MQQGKLYPRIVPPCFLQMPSDVEWRCPRFAAFQISVLYQGNDLFDYGQTPLCRAHRDPHEPQTYYQADWIIPGVDELIVTFFMKPEDTNKNNRFDVEIDGSFGTLLGTVVYEPTVNPWDFPGMSILDMEWTYIGDFAPTASGTFFYGIIPTYNELPATLP
jgi:hypothetical protein